MNEIDDIYDRIVVMVVMAVVCVTHIIYHAHLINAILFLLLQPGTRLGRMDYRSH